MVHIILQMKFVIWYSKIDYSVIKDNFVGRK